MESLAENISMPLRIAIGMSRRDADANSERRLTKSKYAGFY